jgi:isopenicillin-N N-acyltransferase-like protein
VLNHYTDLRDIDAGAWPAGNATDPHGQHADDHEGDSGCSLLWARTESGPILAQTWDMHATAIPYMMVLRVPEHQGRPESWLLSLTGCLGMAGMNRHGVGVAINNLRSADARVGIVWPALVRRALAESTAAAARELIMTAPIGSGHHYMTADAHSAYGIETSGTRRKIVFEAGALDASYVHTNHCLDPEIAQVSREVASSTTHERYDWLSRSIAGAPVRDVHDAWMRLGSDEGYPRSVCSNMSTPENPHGTATCGAVAMELLDRRFWAQAGLIHNVTPERFDFAEIPE